MLGPFQPLLGGLVILLIAYGFSTDRRAIRWSTVAWGLSLQIVFAVIVLKTGAGQAVFKALGEYITKLLDFAYVGSSFVFGPLGNRDVIVRGFWVRESVDPKRWRKRSVILNPDYNLATVGVGHGDEHDL